MCGIAGIFQYNHSETVNSNELSKINNTMQLRGPDDSGLWLNAEKTVGLAHRRLSIIDLSSGAKQPMQLSDSELYITFNGEIYNYQKLRDDLIQQGCFFKTNSDTEVILKLYQVYGIDMLSKLRGMFAFAIWDDKNKSLLCARDPFGIKPFYFSDNGKSFKFASQVKALLQASEINTAQSAAGQIGFYLLGSVPEPYTLYEGIKSLPAGHYLLLNQSGQKIQKEFYSIKSVFIKAENSDCSLNSSSLTESLYDTVKHHLIADVDVGVFLSAGIDSSTLVNIASDILPQKINTITLGFNEYKHTAQDEVPLAEMVSSYFGTHQKTVYISESMAQDEYQKILLAMDQPSIDGINTYFVSQAASQAGLKVALSGLGADELFFGYPLFSRIPKLFNYTKHLSQTGKLFRQLSKKIIPAKYASILEYGNTVSNAYFLSRALYLPWELDFLDPELVKKGLAELNLFERLNQDMTGIKSVQFQLSALELQWYMKNQLLRDSDWASMAHSLEIRVPFVDTVFFETVTQLNAKSHLTKRNLATAPHKALPDAILNKKKTGFNIPVSTWFSKSTDMKIFSKTIYKQWMKSI